MGRAMFIICAGLLASLAYVGLGTTNQMKRIISANAGYAETVQARNAAHTAIQYAMGKMNENDIWRDLHSDINSAITFSINGSAVQLYVEEIYDKDDDPASQFFDPDTIRVVSIAEYFDPVAQKNRQIEVISVYKTNAIDEYVPDFKGALTLTTTKVSLSSSGNASLSGQDSSGTCQDQPAISVISEEKKGEAEDVASSIDVEGEIVHDSTLSYNPTDEMIERLADSDEVNYISGNYKGDFGTPENPGVFFVEDNATLTGGIDEGYGILVIRSNGEMTMEDSTGTEISVGGNFTFNGLVVFENAYNFKGRGTPTINGSVLVGNTDNYSGMNLNVDLNGNIHLQYDCQGEQYAKMAAALAIKQRRYRRLSTFE